MAEPSSTEVAMARDSFNRALSVLLRKAGREVFSPDVQEFVARILDNDVCTECKALPKRHDGPGVPIGRIGTLHERSCSKVSFNLSPEHQAELDKQLAAIRENERQAWRESRDIILGGASGNGPSSPEIDND